MVDADLSRWRCITCGSRPSFPVSPSIDPRWGLSECSNTDCKSKKSTGKKGDIMRHLAPFRRIDEAS